MSNSKSTDETAVTSTPAEGDGLALHGSLEPYLNRAREREEQAHNARTDRTYRAGWDKWLAFTQGQGEPINPVPAPPVVVVAFIEWLAEQGYAANSIDTYLTAVAVAHRDVGRFFEYAEGLAPDGEPVFSDADIARWDAAVSDARSQPGSIDPIKSHAVRKQRENLRKTTDQRTSKRAPILTKHLKAMRFPVDDPDTNQMRDLRDRALIYVGWCLAVRRSELIGLNVEDVRTVADGSTKFHIRRSKTDQQGTKDRMPDIPPESVMDDVMPAFDVHPVDALHAWLDAAGITEGALFRSVDRWGNVRDKRLSGNSVYRIVRKHMEAIGEDPKLYGAHSLRSGFSTQGYIDGVGEHELARQTGHEQVATLRGYQHANVGTKNHPLARMTADPVETDA